MKRFVILLLLVTFALCINSYALRIQRPRHFTYPMTESDVTELNSALEQLFLMQQGRFELDKVSAAKSAANTGEIWVRQTGTDNFFEVMIDGTVYSIPL
jgi:hypothetical protein